MESFVWDLKIEGNFAVLSVSHGGGKAGFVVDTDRLSSAEGWRLRRLIEEAVNQLRAEREEDRIKEAV